MAAGKTLVTVVLTVRVRWIDISGRAGAGSVTVSGSWAG